MIRLVRKTNNCVRLGDRTKAQTVPTDIGVGAPRRDPLRVESEASQKQARSKPEASKKQARSKQEASKKQATSDLDASKKQASSKQERSKK